MSLDPQDNAATDATRRRLLLGAGLAAGARQREEGPSAGIRLSRAGLAWCDGARIDPARQALAVLALLRRMARLLNLGIVLRRLGEISGFVFIDHGFVLA
jgi:hypothetical protein